MYPILLAGYIGVKCCLSPQCTHHVPTWYMGPCPQYEDLELHDLPPLENVTPIPTHIPTIPGFIPFTINTSQHCVSSKGLP